MKKLFFAVLAISALTISSCGNKTVAPADSADSIADSTVVDTTALAPETKSTLNALTTQLADVIKNKDAKGLTTTLANLAATYKALINSGKLQDALTYGKVAKDYVSKNIDAIKAIAGDNTVLTSLISGIENLPTDASTTAEQAKQAVSSKLTDYASSAFQKAVSAGATAKAAAEALKSLPASATEAAENAVTNAKQAATDKANEKVEETKTKAADAVNDAASKTNKAVNDAASKAVKGLGL